MNANRIIGMAVRMIMRRLMRRGINAGIDKATKGKGKGERGQGQNGPDGRKTARNARKTLRLGRIFGRF